MIKSTKSSLKFSNKGKLNTIHLFLEEYKNIVSFFVDELWDQADIKPLLSKNITDKAKTWLSARAVQCAGKQASGIVRGAKRKQSKRLYQINKFKQLGMFKKARKLQKIYDDCKVSKPNIQSIYPELDSRFVKINLNNDSSFDGWIALSSLGNNIKINIPFKKTKHFNLMLERGKLKNGIRLSNSDITFMFELSGPIPTPSNGKTIGIDVGQITALTSSDEQKIERDNHGHTYQSICRKLSQKEKDSKSFKRTQAQRSNFIRWAVKQLNLDGVQVVNLENIKYLRTGSRTSRLMSHWNYAELFDRLENKLIESGVQIRKINPTYTSQRCSACGWTKKNNRKGKMFKCDKCSFECDADLNGSLNISFGLPPIRKGERLRQKNKKGFYWNVVSEEPIVPHPEKTKDIFQYNL